LHNFRVGRIFLRAEIDGKRGYSIVVDNHDAAGTEVVSPADAFQFFEGQQNIDGAFLNQRRVDFFGDADVADDAAAALRHAEGIVFLTS